MVVAFLSNNAEKKLGLIANLNFIFYILDPSIPGQDHPIEDPFSSVCHHTLGNVVLYLAL